MTHNQSQLLKMAQHLATCKYPRAGRFTDSFRLEQSIQSKKIFVIKQIKCTGCGFSLDFQCEEEKTVSTRSSVASNLERSYIHLEKRDES